MVSRRRAAPGRGRALDPVSVGVGTMVGLAGAVAVVLVRDAGLLSWQAVGYAVSATTASAAAWVILSRRGPDRTEVDPFRVVRAQKDGDAPPMAAPEPPLAWAVLHGMGGGEVDVAKTEGLLGRQLRGSRCDYAVEVLTDVLLAMATGRFGGELLDELAAPLAKAAGRGGEPLGMPAAMVDANADIARLHTSVKDAVPGLQAARFALSERHRHPATRLLGALADARARDVVPVSDFAWLPGSTATCGSRPAGPGGTMRPPMPRHSRALQGGGRGGRRYRAACRGRGGRGVGGGHRVASRGARRPRHIRGRRTGGTPLSGCMTVPASHVRCPHCGGRDVVRDRECEVEVSFMDGGRVSSRRGRVLRVACKAAGCGRHGTVRHPGDVSAERKVRDHVVARLFELGQTGASQETGLGRATVQRHAEAWSSLREGDVAAAAPAFLLLGHARLRMRDAFLVADADRRALVEILDGHDALAQWLGKPGRKPATRACIPLDPRLREDLARAWPGMRTMVAPATIARAIRSLALRAFGAVRRAGRVHGSNGFPSGTEFADALRREADTGGWPLAVLGLLAGAKAALAVAAAPDRATGERLWPEFELAARDVASGGLAGLMREWREQVLEGLAHRFLDASVALLDGVRRALAARRPPLGFADLRRFAVLRPFERRVEGGGGAPVARGSCLSRLRADLLQAAAPG